MQEQNIFVLKERKEIAGHKQNDFQQVDSNWNALESSIHSHYHLMTIQCGNPRHKATREVNEISAEM